MFTSIVFSIGPSLFNILFTFFTYIGLSIFFNLNLYFLVNSEIMTNSIALLSNNASIVTPSYVSTLSNPIFTITSLNMSPLSRLYVDVLSTILESIANLVLLRSSQGLPDLLPHLNYFVHIPVFFLLLLCSLSFYSCSFLPYIQVPHNCNNSSPHL